MTLRSQRLVCVLAGAVLALALLQAATGSGGGLVFMAPAILVMLPLLVGHYFGEAQIARLGARGANRRTAARAPRVRGHAQPVRRVLCRGGALIGRSLAVRPPPSVLPA